jgi:hypothetical protein
MIHKWGAQVPNGEFNPSDIVDCFGDGFYIIMQGEFNRLPALRDAAPNALIMARFYLPNWYITNAATWAHEVAQILNQVNLSDPKRRRNRDLIDCYTWANEQNLKVESGGVIGSSPGDMIKPGQWEIIRDWNLGFLRTIDETDCRDIKRVFPATAVGNSDDQDDGAGVGLAILQPVIELCHYGAIHPYWSADKPIDDEWHGLGRIHKSLPFFSRLPVLVTETGNFAVTREDSPQQYLSAGYYMQGIPQIFGFGYFIWADPTKQHQQNDMSRNPRIAEALRTATRTERPVEWVPQPGEPPDTPPAPDPTPEPNPPPPASTGELVIGYQVWQWSGVRTIANYDHLKNAMDQIGARLLTDKYSDSNVLQGQFDNDPMAVTSIQVMKDRKKWCDDNGFIYAPWDVPRAIPVNGDPFKGAKQEALFHADVCNQVGLEYRVSDLEFYESFFGYSLPRNGKVTDYFGSMAARNDGAELYYRTFAENSNTKTILQPDPRQWNTIQFARLLPYIYSIVWQSYASWFRSLGDDRTHAAIIQDSINKAKQLEISHFGLTLYSDWGAKGDTPPHLAAEMLEQAVQSGAELVLVYKAPIDPDLHEVIRAFAGDISMPGDIENLKARAWAAAENMRKGYGTDFGLMADEARALGYGWMANGFDAVRLAVESLELAAKTATKAPKE